MIKLESLVYSDPLQDFKSLATRFLSNESKVYGNAQYSELVVLLASLRAVNLIHQQNHWQAQGNTQYGDHLLFQRLYEGTVLEIDKVAEKVVGLSYKEYVNIKSQLCHIESFTSLFEDSSQGCETSYQAELLFLSIAQCALTLLEQQKLMTPGLEQCIGDIMNKHEEHSYLLKQRYQPT